MKFILAYTICSALTGMCNNTALLPVEFDSWTDCTKAGAVASIEIVNNNLEQFNEEKLYISYFCNQVEGQDA